MIVSICNEKGGSGKSTLATNIAINQSLSKNELPLLIDTDPQKSIATFLNIRNEENNPKVFDFTYKYGENLKEFLQNYNSNKDVIIDTGGRDSREMRIAIALSDMVIIPTIPSQFDVSVLDKMVNIIKMAKEQNEKLVAYIVINRASTNPFLYKKIESLRNFIEELEQDYIKLSQTIVYERERYKVATQLGLGVVEMKDGNKAEQEIRDLCNEICT
ncbi:AAA family ATPase [Campylobacter fetus]|uniref:AAA family ATPase n=1 Tax=Campylobacter fetus TaxID=196 RepID=UPI0003FEBF29|nr:AAA family ATPase [Campylobacter fetus]OCS34865.1 chromosome partitioning protein ParA [Campylobacter fetus subsp. venerealis]OCS38306.1 chromosome partitioning protein ParA [Campylobacter fetus subsp. venerealis cfvi02/298]KAA3685439.1 chromosome partitioning protein ParA [Campylobacter fetus subsp. fetus]OCS20227.1 chromosome partitioning protein ParA [Campylobacter fetus subsp. venerealis cfvi03/596]OCS25081.1 chromosome partitioning protein ParA [Campylobacter fetus subsp. venerealis cf